MDDVDSEFSGDRQIRVYLPQRRRVRQNAGIYGIDLVRAEARVLANAATGAPMGGWGRVQRAPSCKCCGLAALVRQPPNPSIHDRQSTGQVTMVRCAEFHRSYH